MRIARILVTAFAALALTLTSIGVASPAFASSSGCNGYAASPDWSGTVCTGIDGTNLYTTDIYGSYQGNYNCSYLDLYINGSRVESSNFCKSYYPHTFSTGYHHTWPGTTYVKVCVRFIQFIGQVCGPQLKIYKK